MKRPYSENKKKHEGIIIAILIFVAILLTIGYSAFSTELSIYGISAIVRVQKDVRIDNITLSSSTDNAISYYEDYNVKNIYTRVSLPNTNSSVTYDIVIHNLGNVEMGILDITGLPNNLKYTISNYTLKDPLCDDLNSSQCKLGTTTTLHLKIEYDENGFDENNDIYQLDLLFDFKRIHKIIYNGFASTTGLPTSILEDETKTITFNNTTSIPLNVIVAGATSNYSSPTLTLSNPNNDITVYKKHLITYILDGGTQAEHQETTISSNESITLLNPTKNGYNFGGWYNNSNFSGEPIIQLSNVTSDITLYAEWIACDYFLSHADFDGTAGTIINTGIKLYSAENVNKNFRIKFTIDSYDNSYNSGNISKNNAPTLFSSIDESGSPWPGFVYRVQGTNTAMGNGYFFQINDSHVAKFSSFYDLNSNIDVEIVRENGDMYIKINSNDYTKVLSYGSVIDTFDVPLTIGGNINEQGNYARFFKGSLSNVSVEFYEDDFIGNNVYSYIETKTSTSYTLDGTIEFTGQNYIDTGLDLYSAQNINKDFEITLTIDSFGKNTGQATLINVKDESQNNIWPGFAYRGISSDTKNFELTARWPGENDGNTLSLKNKIQAPKIIKLARRSGVVYYSFDDAVEEVLISTPPSSLTLPFNQNVTFGASLNSSGTPFRYFVGIVSDISIRLLDD